MPLNNFIVPDKVSCDRMAGEEFNLRALERLLELPGLQMELELSSSMGGTLPQQDSHLVCQPPPNYPRFLLNLGHLIL